MRRGLLLLAWVLLRALPAAAQADSLATPADSLTAPADSVAVARVRTLEQERQTAMVKADTRTLAEIFAENATYVHSNGLMQTRHELFRLLESGDIRYVAFALEDVRYRAYDRTVVGTGVQRIHVKSAGKSLELRSRYTVVYAATAGDWKLVAYQSTPVPDLAPRPGK